MPMVLAKSHSLKGCLCRHKISEASSTQGQEALCLHIDDTKLSLLEKAAIQNIVHVCIYTHVLTGFTMIHNMVKYHNADDAYPVTRVCYT